MFHGIVGIYKEKGYTSHDVVGKLRGILKQKRIGHTGTLDPDAEGVLPVCLGVATKACDMLTDSEKIYEAVISFGITTDTQDITGSILKQTEITEFDEEKVKETILGFQGEYAQIPPMYSALKVNGKKLYEYAREGIEIERKPRMIQIYSINLLWIDKETHRASFEVSCSKGTYIRTLCHDIGEKLGFGACMSQLTRVKTGGFFLKDCYKLSEIEEKVKEGCVGEVIRPVESFFLNYPRLNVTPEGDRRLKNGNLLEEEHIASLEEQKEEITPAWFRVHDMEGEFQALYEKRNGTYHPAKTFFR